MTTENSQSEDLTASLKGLGQIGNSPAVSLKKRVMVAVTVVFAAIAVSSYYVVRTSKAAPVGNPAMAVPAATPLVATLSPVVSAPHIPAPTIFAAPRIPAVREVVTKSCLKLFGFHRPFYCATHTVTLREGRG
jgi:hypothetical protein